MDRMEVMQSPAYLAMTPSGKRVLHIIEGMTSRNGGEPVALSHSYFVARKMTQASSCKAVKQLVALGFVTVEADKRPNTFTLCDNWQSIDADEAKRRMALARQPKPQRPSSKPPKPKPVKPEPKPMTVAPRIMRRAPSLPTMPWMDDGR